MSFFTSASLAGDNLPNNAVAIASAWMGVPGSATKTLSTELISEPAIVGLAVAVLRVFTTLVIAAGLTLLSDLLCLVLHQLGNRLRLGQTCKRREQ
jgi:hypothetical protein